MEKRFRFRPDSMAHGGEAVGRYKGKVVFVPYTLPGEEVLVEIVEDKKRYVRARPVEVLSPAPQRVVPRCPHFGLCGGCHWQHIDYAAQLEFKESILRNQLARLGGVKAAPIRPVIGMAEPWCYRNHIQFALTDDGRLGFVAARSSGRARRVVPIEVCYVLHPLLDGVLTALDLAPSGLKRLSLRAGINTGQRMIIFETEDDEPPDLEVDFPLSCVLLLSDGRAATLIGKSHIVESLAGREYRISAGSFFQVNTVQAEALVHQVINMLGPSLQGDETLLDAYCGVGIFALSLADRLGRVIGVEEKREAIADARLNAAAADLENVDFIQGRVEDVLPGLEEGLELVILDPPRQGCRPETLKAVAGLGPTKIVYVSCDPATLARDVGTLLQNGYKLVEVRPVDMFPQTYHVEAIALLHKISSI
jgi:23S rRNA (uracil1939-C5)-methyltransferase